MRSSYGSSMMKRILFILATFALYSSAYGGHGSYFWKLKKHLLRKQLLSRPLHDPPINVTTGSIVQPLDHFDPLVTKNFTQDYYMIQDFWKQNPTGPVILYIAGEAPLSKEEVISGHHVQMAEMFGALVFAVEHRFYGNSQPKEGMKLDVLQYLSSQEALADLAAFISFAKLKYKLTDTNLWISVGGSYSGDLSAWLNIKYPHLIHASLASSAPLRAVVDFQGYNDVVTASLNNTYVGGSKECIGNISAAFATIDSLVKAKKFGKLKQDFKLCSTPESKLDLEVFTSNLAGIFMGFVQYNEGTGKDSTIYQVCGPMTQTSDPYQNLVNFEAQVKGMLGLNCMNISYKNYLLDFEADDNIRAWIYQTCSQFGYYQTCDVKTNCSFSHQVDLTLDLSICKDVYHIPAETVYRQANFTNQYYGSTRPKGTRILFVNGSIDPWHSLSVLKTLSSDEPALFINGTSHCENMRGHQETNPPQLEAALKTIESTLEGWISQGATNTI